MSKKFQKIVGHQMFLPIFCLLLVLLFNIIKTPNFFEIRVQNGVLYGYLIDVVNRASELIILAIGMTLVVASSAGTDISVGAVAAVAGGLCCLVLNPHDDAYNYANPYFLALLAGLGGGLLCGLFNGLLVAKLRIQPMVATLILFSAGRGIAQLLSNGLNIYVNVEQFKYLGNFIPGVPLPTPVFIAVFMLVITWLVLRKTPLGLYIESVGINKRASRLVGINSELVIWMTYAYCGLCAAVAGLIIVSRVHLIDANNAGLNLELDAILAVAIGGNSLAGGKFSLAGSVVGALTIQALTTSLYAMQVTSDQLPIYKAIVVVIIVSLQSEGFKRWINGLKKNHALKAKEA